MQGIVATRTTSGSKTDTPLLQTPQAVSVVGAEQIELQRAQTIGEATRYTPGIRSEKFGNDSRNDWFSIRGFDAETRGYFLDNLQLFSTSFATFKVEPFGMERIEVLRGPSSVLYGGSNPGGLVNAISKKPPTEPLHFVEFGINNFGRTYGAFDFGGPVYSNNQTSADGQFFYRVTGIAKAGGTQTDFTGDDRYHIAPAFTWKPTEDTTLTILGSFTHDSTNGQNFLPYSGTVQPASFGKIPTRLFTSDRALDRFERTQALLGYQLEHRIDDVFTVRQNLRYSYLDIDFRTVYGGGYASPGVLQRFNFDTRPRVNLFNVDNSVEARFATGALSHTALLGLDYRRYNLADNQAFIFGTSLNLLTGVSTPNRPLTAADRYINARFIQDQLGAYLQDQIRFGRFTLALSGRYDFVSTQSNNYIVPSASNQGEEGRFSGRAGLIYASEWGIAPYVSYANSFNPQVGLNGATQRPYRSEKGEQVEVGVKYQPLGSNSYIGVAAFDLRRQNVLTADPLTPILQTQIGEVRSRGVEFEAVAELARGFKMIGAYTLSELETTKDGILANIGRRPTNIPTNFGGLFFDYTVQDGPLTGLGFGGGVRYVGHSYADVANQFKVPSYVVGDAQIHYDLTGWRLGVNVTNLTDEVFVSSCSSVTACFYGERRKITGSLSYRW